MSRGVDVTLYRVVIIFLVVVALIFSVILTNVFVDIEGLLVKKTSQPIVQAITEKRYPYPNPDINEDSQTLSSNEEEPSNLESFRTKRSLESNKLIYQIKSPKIKKILTNHLATLLQELDEEKSSQDTKTVNDFKGEYNEKPKELDEEESSHDLKKLNGFKGEVRVKSNIDEFKEEYIVKQKDLSVDKGEVDYRGDEVNDNLTSVHNNDRLHVALHNILLQGIVGHMDVNDVYKKVHLLFQSLDEGLDSKTKATSDGDPSDRSTELMKIISQNYNNEENRIFEEILKCKKLQKQILQSQNQKNETAKDPLIVIKTVVEIINENMTNPPKDVKGLVKLKYNGKPIRVEEIAESDNDKLEAISKPKNIQENTEMIPKTFETSNEMKQNPILNRAIEEYLRTHTFKLKNNLNLFTKESVETKRLKRQIKIRHKGNMSATEKSNQTQKNPKKNDDELYIEIETHIDGKGTKSEKKKKLVRFIVDKIQKAINSKIEELENHTKATPVQVKKRVQDPIEHVKDALKVDTLKEVKTVEHRLLSPISKTANVIQPLTSVLDKYGETWKRMYYGPSFLTPLKSLNSAEMRELDIDYNSVLSNGIPKRLQNPINTENGDIAKFNEDPGTGNVTLYLKEIDGSGFTIGINQYPNEPLNKENLQMFADLENQIKTYHERYDQPGTSNELGGNTDAKRNLRSFGVTERRRKRSVKNVNLVRILQSKTKMNKFINTKVMKSKKIFLKNKRNKRHVDRVRIVASDRYPQHSQEDIFVVSEENAFADRAVIKNDNVPELEIGDKYEKHYDYIEPYEMNSYKVPRIQPYITNVYDTKSLQTELMAHYPHILVENMSNSKEDFINRKPISRERREPEIIEPHKFGSSGSKTTLETDDNEQSKPLPHVDEIVKAIIPRANYKVTVKIFPKNKTDIIPGYKEVHTMINKRYDKDGLRYVSSVNVSEVSKLESSNRTEGFLRTKKIADDELENQRDQIKMLLKLHKQGIDHQLEYLKDVSQKLRDMIGERGENIEMSKINNLVNVLKQLGPNDIKKKNSTTEHRPHVNDITKPKTEKQFSENETKNDNPVKNKLIKTIEQNESLTKAILEKIDNNTNILQSFLQSLSDKFQSKRHADTKSEKPLMTEADRSSAHVQEKSPFLEELHGNFSQPIPFIYAFQPPVVQNKGKPFKNVANVIYHGHIYANRGDHFDERNDFFKDIAKSIKLPNSDSNNKLSNNESRFFIENYFKPTPELTPVPVTKTNVTAEKI